MGRFECLAERTAPQIAGSRRRGTEIARPSSRDVLREVVVDGLLVVKREADVMRSSWAVFPVFGLTTCWKLAGGRWPPWAPAYWAMARLNCLMLFAQVMHRAVSRAD